VVSGKGVLSLLDAQTLEERFSLPDVGASGAASFQPSGGLLAYAGADRHLWLFDVSSGERVGELAGGDADVTTLTFSHDGHWLAVGDAGGRTTIWTTVGWRKVLRMPPHTTAVDDVAFSADDKAVITRAGYTIRRWSVPDGRLDGNTFIPATENDQGLLVGLEAGRFARLVGDGRVSFGAIATPTGEAAPQDVPDGYDLSGAFVGVAAPDRVALWSTNSGIQLWDPASNKLQVTFHPSAYYVADVALTRAGPSFLALMDGHVTSRLMSSLDDGLSHDWCGIAVSPGGKRVATATWPGASGETELILWSTQDGRIASRVDTGKDSACFLRYTPDGASLVSGTSDHITVRTASTGALARRIDVLNFDQTSYAFLPGNRLLGFRRTLDDRNKIHADIVAVDLGSGAVTPVADPGSYPDWITASPDGTRFSTQDGAECTVWDLATGQKRVSFRFDGRSLEWSPDDKLVGADSGKIVRLDPSTGALVDAVHPPELRGRSAPVVARGGQLATYVTGGSLHVWDVATQRDRAVFATAGCEPAAAIGERPIVESCDDGRTIVVGARPGAEPVLLGPKVRRTPDAHLVTAHAPLFDPRGERIAFVDGSGSMNAGRLWVWNLKSGAVTIGDTYDGQRLSWSPDSRTIAVGKSYNGVSLVDATSLSAQLLDTRPPDQRVLTRSGSDMRAAFADRGKRVVYVADKHAVVWDVESGRAVKDIPGEPIAIAPNGEWLAFPTPPKPPMKAPPEGPRHASKMPRRYAPTPPKPPPVYPLILRSPNGQTRTVHLEINTGIPGTPSGVAFSVDGKLLTAWMDTRLEVLDVTTDLKRLSLQVPSSDIVTIQNVAFSPDGKRLLVVGSEPAARLFDVDTGKLLSQLSLPSDEWSGRSSIGFRPDGRMIALSGKHGLFLWMPDSGKTVQLRLFGGLEAAVLQSVGDDSQIELLGADAASARDLLRCRSGARTTAFETCAAVVEKRNLFDFED
jgi:WD40 repeat protein